MHRTLVGLGLATALAFGATAAHAAENLPRQLDGVSVSEHLGQQVDLSLPFVDQQGRSVTLRDYVRGDVPVLLTLNYYRCRMLCSLQLNALVRGLRGLSWSPGDKFRIVTVSINPREGPELAREKRASYLRSLGRGDVDWSFLTGQQQHIEALARTVGFSYRYIKKEDQYAHPAVVFFLSPDGRVMRYLYGIDFPTRELRFALIEASEGRAGSPLDKVLLTCFHYDPQTGRYTTFAVGIMRLGGIVTLLVLGLVIGLLWLRERRRSRKASSPPAP